MQDERFEVEQRVNKALWDPSARHSVVLSDQSIELPEGSESESATRIGQLDAMLNPSVTGDTGESAAAEHLRRLEALLNGDESASLAEAVSTHERVADPSARLAQLDATLAPVEDDATVMIEPSETGVDDAWGTGFQA